ncbi:MAG: OmpA family protein [Geminicoccaceae bacterium]
MNKQPTERELISALKLKGKTRGLQQTEDADPPSVDLTVNFEFDSAELTEDAMVTLGTVAGALNSTELEDQNFLIEGHTDAVGSEDYNALLSERRAVAVSSYLISLQDVSSDRLNPVGKGEHELLEPEDPEAAQNRRVRVKVLMD